MSDKAEHEKRKFKYENTESVDSVFNYIATINKGLKSRHLTLGTDDDMIDMVLPENIDLEIKAKTKKDGGSVTIELKWKMDEEGEKARTPEAATEKEGEADVADPAARFRAGGTTAGSN